MPKVHTIKTNFTGGEFSPLLEGRVDLDQYQNAVSELKNFLIMPHGGVTRRGGFHYVDNTKYYDSDRRARLIPFQYSSVQAYILEFGGDDTIGYIRFFMDGYLIKVVTGAELVTNGDFPANILNWDDRSTGTGSIAWNAGGWMDVIGGAAGVGWAEQDIVTVPGTEYRLTFDVANTDVVARIGTTSTGDETLEDTVVPIGTERHIIFTAEDVLTYIQFRQPDNETSEIDNVTVQEWIPYEIASPYIESDLPEIKYAQSSENLYLVHPLVPPQILTRNAHDDWAIADMDFLDGPYYDEEAPANTPTITPDWTGPSTQLVDEPEFDAVGTWVEGANWNIADGVAIRDGLGAGTLDQNIGAAANHYWVTYTINAIAGGTLHVDIGGTNGTARAIPGTYSEVILGGGGANISFEASAPGVTCEIDNVTVYRCSILTAGDDLWEADHAGTLWRIQHAGGWGYCELVEFIDEQNFYARVYSAIGAVASLAWREGSWGPHSGYPTSVCFHEDRSVFAGTDGQPQTFWGSKCGKYNDFTPGVDDADAYYYTLGSGQVDIILWLASTKFLLLGTQGAEYVAKGGSDNSITPSNIDVKAESTNGSASIQPLRIGNCVLFVQSAGRKIRELGYDWQSDAYYAPDLTLLAEHLVYDGVLDMTYQQEPYSMVWVHTNEGLPLSLTYERTQKIVGWAQHPTDGIVESKAVITNRYIMEDELWVIVNRTIGANTRRYIERMDMTNYTDCCLIYSGDPVTQVWGADHLIGKTVDIRGDGAVYPQAVVGADGSVILDGPPASEIEVGLHFTSSILTLRPEINTQQGTSQGITKHWSKLGVRLFETIGISINGKMIEFRIPDDPMDEGVSLFSGDKWMTNLGRDKDAKVLIEQTQPLPCTVICIIGIIDFGD